MTKSSHLVVKKGSGFEKKRISSSGVFDEIQGISVEEHINNELIHLHRNDFSPAAFSGDYDDLENTPDILEIINDTLRERNYATVGIGEAPDGSTIFFKIIDN
ncbi:MAG: hypothetical protein LBS84_05490 [Clostridiales bacterium]|jgi:hypothetical protein|nr:hypothetical protein [Clostridiales bacterium]